MNSFEGRGKSLEEMELMQQAQDTISRGFEVTRSFNPQQAKDLQPYLDQLKASGKQPNQDYSFIVHKGYAVVLEKKN